MRQLDIDTQLEMDKVRRIVSLYCRTSLGAAGILNSGFQRDGRWIIDEQDLCWETRRAMAEGFQPELEGVSALEGVLGTLRVVNKALEAGELLTVVRNVDAGARIRRDVDEVRHICPRLAAEAEAVPDLSFLSRAIRKVVKTDGTLADSASPELKRIRGSLKSLRGRILKRLEEITNRAELSHVLQEDYITIRDDRYVILVKSEHKGVIPGIVHSRSSTEATYFVEPFATVEQNNGLILAREEERAEVNRILLRVTHEVREHAESLRVLISALGRFDALAGKARFADAVGAARPKITLGGGRLTLVGARHPLLDERIAGKRAEAGLTAAGASQKAEELVPLDLELDEGERSMVITGPNAGGKTVALKTVGLVSLMLQNGLPPPVGEGSELPVFESVETHIGDRQDIIANLSTFTARLMGIKEIVDHLEPPALVLLDEIGTGTDPTEGAALAMAIIDHFHDRGAYTLATTHHQLLKSYAFGTEGVVNSSMACDETTLKPTFRLIRGVPGSSNALKVAESLQFPPDVLERARTYLGDQDRQVEKMVGQLESTLARIRNEEELISADRDRLAALVEEQEREKEVFVARENKVLEERMNEAEQVMARFSAEVERLVDGLKDRAVAEKVRAAARKERKRLAVSFREARTVLTPTRGPEARPPRPLEPGERIRLRRTSLSGRVIEDNPEREEATVEVEGKRMILPRIELILAEDQDGSGGGGKSGAARAGAGRPRLAVPFSGIELEGSDRLVTSELNLVGEHVDEALSLTDKYLDDATLAGLDMVRIIHGIGSGALRRAVSELLDGHPHVDGFRPAAQTEGGAGVTVVQLKK